MDSYHDGPDVNGQRQKEGDEKDRDRQEFQSRVKTEKSGWQERSPPAKNKLTNQRSASVSSPADGMTYCTHTCFSPSSAITAYEHTFYDMKPVGGSQYHIPPTAPHGIP